MNNKTNLTTKKTMAIKPKNKRKESPKVSRPSDSPCHDDSSSFCDSDCSSPTPFMFTQDGGRGENEIVWGNTPKIEKTSTPYRQRHNLSRKCKRLKSEKNNINEMLTKKISKFSQKKSQFLENFKLELLELNQNVQNMIKTNVQSPVMLESDDDVFNSSLDSPKSALGSLTKSNKKCLRRTLLSSTFAKPETETALESDDSMNEHLIRASQVIEENIDYLVSTPSKRPSSHSFTTPQLNNITNKSNNFTNDSFENVLMNMNDRDMERLSQVHLNSPKHELTKPAKAFVMKTSVLNRSPSNMWKVQKSCPFDEVPSPKSCLNRTNSLPESPRINGVVKPSTSGMSLNRYNSMPQKCSDSGDPSFKCTQDEIRKKHQQAKEKLLAKRNLPFMTKQSMLKVTKEKHNTPPNNITKEKLNTPEKNANTTSKQSLNFGIKNVQKNFNNLVQKKEEKSDLKALIERKRQEALMRLQKKRMQNIT